MKKLAIATLVLLLTASGCSSLTEKQKESFSANQTALTQAYITAQSKDLLTISCPETGCVFNKLTVANPNVSMPTLSQPVDQNARMLQTVVSGAVQIGSIVAGGAAAKNLVEATGAAVGGALSLQKDPLVVQNPTQIVEPTVVEPTVITNDVPYVVTPIIQDPVVIDPVVIKIPTTSSE